MEDQRFLFAVYVVAKDEDDARDLMRMATTVADKLDADERFIDEWHAIERLGTHDDVFGTKR